MRTSHKLTRLVLALMSLTALASSLFAQVFQPPGNPGNNQPGVIPAIPPGNTVYAGQNFPTPQPPGFRGNWNNENGATQTGGINVSSAGTGRIAQRPAIIDPPAQVQVSDQKPGSMLVYPYYTSNLQTGSNTWVTLSNSSDRYAVLVHIFFIEGTNCTQADQFICLTPNASLQMRASDFDPDTRKGWILAVAVDRNGKPAQRNFLTGNAFVTDGNNVGNYGAESFTAYSNRATSVINAAGASAVADGATPNSVAINTTRAAAGTVNSSNTPGNAAAADVLLPAAVPDGSVVVGDPACRFDSQLGGFVSGQGYNGNGYVPGLFDDNITTAGLNLTGPPTFCWSRDSNLAVNPPTADLGLTDLRTFQLNGGGYDFAPNRFTVEIQSPVDVPGQQIITVGLSGDLNSATTSGGAQVGTGVVINGNETPFGSFVNFITGRCQSMGTIDNVTPRVPRGVGNLIPAGNVGTLNFSVTAGVGIIITPRNNGKGTSGIRTLHKTNVNTAVANGGTQNIFGDGLLPLQAATRTSIRRYGVQLTIPVYLPPTCGTVTVAEGGNIID